jgi:hypothetical protein
LKYTRFNKEDLFMLSPETFPIITGIKPQHGDTWADGSDAICLKNAKGVLIIVQHAGVNNTDYTLHIHEGSTAALAAAGGTTMAATFQIWKNEASAASDTLVRATDAVSVLVNADAATEQLIVLYVPASNLTSGNNWIALGSSAGHAANFNSVLYILDGERYQQTTPLTAIV